MGQVHPIPARSDELDTSITRRPTVMRPVSVRCGLCGARLGVAELSYRLISPHGCEMVTVCHTCRNAAIGEGYRPAE